MSMSTFIFGIVPPDKEYKRMKAVWDVCTEAGIEIPEAVDAFFEYEKPEENGMKIGITDIVSNCSEPYTTGYEIDLSKLPEKVKFIRFVNSW